MSLFVLLLLFACCHRDVDALSCYNCANTRLPSDCKNTVTCGVNEECVIQKTSGGYNTGCIASWNCSQTLGHIVVGRRALNQTYQCSKCCSYDHCNNVGCGTEGQAIRLAEKFCRSQSDGWYWNRELKEFECNKYLSKGYFYDSVTGMCARVVNSPVPINYSEAEKDCQKDGASIITVDDDDKQYFLLGWIYTHKRNTDFWIGLTKNTSDGFNFHWKNNEPVKYDYWGRAFNKQPSDTVTGNEDCVYLEAADDFRWHDGKCDEHRAGYICEIWNVTGGANSLSRICRQKVFQGYLYDKATGMCFSLQDSNTIQFTQSEAAANCASDGATLAKVSSELRTDLVKRWIYSNQANKTRFWIGLEDVGNSTFQWPDGTSIIGYDNWGGPDIKHNTQTQPNRQNGDEDCVYMSRANDYKWFADQCNDIKNGFICQHHPLKNETYTPGGGCFGRLSTGYFYDVLTRMCVKVVTNGTWDRNSALNICQTQGDGLLEITNPAKATFIQYLVTSLGHYGTHDFWIGARYWTNTNRFGWEMTNSSFAYTNWYENVEKPKNCVVLDHTDQYKWAPKECDYETKGFVCELDSEALSRLAGSKQTI